MDAVRFGLQNGLVFIRLGSCFNSFIVPDIRIKHIFHRVQYVEDAILYKLDKAPSSELGRDLLFVQYFRVRLKNRLEINKNNWYPIHVEDYISWQLIQFEEWQKGSKNKRALQKGYGYDIDYLKLELALNTIVDNDDWGKLILEINSIWKRWRFHKKYIIPNSAQYRNDLDKWKI